MTTEPWEDHPSDVEALEALVAKDAEENHYGLDLEHRAPRSPDEAFAMAKMHLAGLGYPNDGLEFEFINSKGPEWYLSTATHCVRLSKEDGLDQRRDVAMANRARRLSVMTPICHFAQSSWSVWGRTEGERLMSQDGLPRRFWNEFLLDLARLHSEPAPVDSPKLPMDSWRAYLLDLDGLEAHERWVLDRVCFETDPPRRLTFIHGALEPFSLLMTANGQYGGMVDWQHARWGPPELDYVWLESEGLRIAMDHPSEVVDWGLVAALRVGMLVESVAKEESPLIELQEALGFWQLMN